MNKDVIYIDVEDDITAIIGKVKDAKEKIVALVPPKRIGVLQSAVNLRLLTRAATQSDKRLVLITNNSALMALAASAKVPVAKNLQSKPELAEVPALQVDGDDDMIDGSQLPVGELDRTSGEALAAPLAESALVATEQTSSSAGTKKPLARATPPAPGQTPDKPRAKKGSGVKVPNFNTFRKKLLLIGLGAALLISFFVWAIFFAPHAKIIIAARTTDASLNDQVTLTGAGHTDVDKKTIKMTTQQIEDDVSYGFEATGEKNVGDKATGTVNFSNSNTSETTIAAGTTFTTSGGLEFTLDSTVVVPAAACPGSIFNCFEGEADGAVTAVEPGKNYNGANGSLSGAPSGTSTSFDGSASGGTDKIVAVVTQADIQKAKEDLAKQDDVKLKAKLKDQFDSNVVVIDSTFKIDGGEVKSSPAADAEAPNGKAKLIGTITYTMAGVDKKELADYLDSYFKQQLDDTNGQRVYNNGLDSVSFTNVDAEGSVFKASLVANAQIGPKIDEAEIRAIAKGKRYGEIQSQIEAIQGVDSVDIKFSPFWVSTAPNDNKRISIEFKLND